MAPRATSPWILLSAGSSVRHRVQKPYSPVTLALVFLCTGSSLRC